MILLSYLFLCHNKMYFSPLLCILWWSNSKTKFKLFWIPVGITTKCGSENLSCYLWYSWMEFACIERLVRIWIQAGHFLICVLICWSVNRLFLLTGWRDFSVGEWGLGQGGPSKIRYRSGYRYASRSFHTRDCFCLVARVQPRILNTMLGLTHHSQDWRQTPQKDSEQRQTGNKQTGLIHQAEVQVD